VARALADGTTPDDAPMANAEFSCCEFSSAAVASGARGDACVASTTDCHGITGKFIATICFEKQQLVSTC
jgi:hypothetical protein